MPLPFPSPFSFVFVFVLFLFSSLSLLVDCPSANQQTEGQVYSEPVHPPLPTPPLSSRSCLPPSLPRTSQTLLSRAPTSIPWAPLVLAFPLIPKPLLEPAALSPGPCLQGGLQRVLRAQTLSLSSWFPLGRPLLPSSVFSVPPRQLNSGERSATSHPAGKAA